MASLKKIKKLCDELGVDFQDDEFQEAFYLYSSQGEVFSALTCSTLMYSYTEDGRRIKRETYKEIEEDLSYGTEKAPEGFKGWWY